MFEIYPISELSPPLLTVICAHRRSDLLKAVIEIIESRFSVKATFVSEIEKEHPEIT